MWCLICFSFFSVSYCRYWWWEIRWDLAFAFNSIRKNSLNNCLAGFLPFICGTNFQIFAVFTVMPKKKADLFFSLSYLNGENRFICWEREANQQILIFIFFYFDFLFSSRSVVRDTRVRSIFVNWLPLWNQFHQSQKQTHTRVRCFSLYCSPTFTNTTESNVIDFVIRFLVFDVVVVVVAYTLYLFVSLTPILRTFAHFLSHFIHKIKIDTQMGYIVTQQRHTVRTVSRDLCLRHDFFWWTHLASFSCLISRLHTHHWP